MNEPAKLKLCPFCGVDSVSVSEFRYGGWFAKCGWCGAEIGHPDSESEAAAAWNRRAERTGRWIALGNRYFECSVCHCQQCGEDKYGNPMAANNPEHKQCPCCGAHMIGG